MIRRFRTVIPKVLYRGAFPSHEDVIELQKKLGIKKIVSLDKETGDKIDHACKELGIEHVKMYIDHRKSTLLHFLTQDLRKLFLQGGPTFVHCHEGRDRTGLASALVKCKFLGMAPEKAIEEAKSLGFGVGIDPTVMHLYEKIIRACKPAQDQNNADIVSNNRSGGDNRDSYLEESNRSSFAPYMDHTRVDPQNFVYNYINDRTTTRDNRKANEALDQVHDFGETNIVPQTGIFNNECGTGGFGPVINPGGFIYD